MNLEQLIQGPFEGIPMLRDIEDAAFAEGVSTEELLNRFSRVVADRYLRGVYDYGSADKAMNNIFAVAHRDGNGLPLFAWDVYGTPASPFRKRSCVSHSLRGRRPVHVPGEKWQTIA